MFFTRPFNSSISLKSLCSSLIGSGGSGAFCTRSCIAFSGRFLLLFFTEGLTDCCTGSTAAITSMFFSKKAKKATRIRGLGAQYDSFTAQFFSNLLHCFGHRRCCIFLHSHSIFTIPTLWTSTFDSNSLYERIGTFGK